MGGIQGLGFGILFVLMGGVDGVLEGLWVVGGEARRASVPWQYIGALQQCNHIIRGAVTAHSSTAECSRIIRALLKCIEHWSTAKVQSHRRQRHCGSAFEHCKSAVKSSSKALRKCIEIQALQKCKHIVVNGTAEVHALKKCNQAKQKSNS